MILLGGNKLLDLSGATPAIGVCLMLWGVFTLGLWVSTFRHSWLVFLIFLTLWIAFFLLGGGALLGNPMLHAAGGWVGFHNFARTYDDFRFVPAFKHILLYTTVWLGALMKTPVP